MAAVPVMHEQMHQRAEQDEQDEQDEQEGKHSEEVRPVLGEEEEAEHDNKSQPDPGEQRAMPTPPHPAVVTGNGIRHVSILVVTARRATAKHLQLSAARAGWLIRRGWSKAGGE